MEESLDNVRYACFRSTERVNRSKQVGGITTSETELTGQVIYQKAKPRTGALLAQHHVVLDVIVLDTPDVGTRK